MHLALRLAVAPFQGVPYEAPSDDLILTEQDILAKLAELKPAAGGNRSAQIVRFLTYDQIRDLLEKLRGRAKVQLLVKTDAAPSQPPANAPRAAQPPVQGGPK